MKTLFGRLQGMPFVLCPRCGRSLWCRPVHLTAECVVHGQFRVCDPECSVSISTGRAVRWCLIRGWALPKHNDVFEAQVLQVGGAHFFLEGDEVGEEVTCGRCLRRWGPSAGSVS